MRDWAGSSRFMTAIVSIALLAGIDTASGGVNRWTSIGLYGDEIAPFAAHPTGTSRIYAAADGVLMKTGDGGAHWTDAGLAAYRVLELLAIDPQSPTTVYAVPTSIFPGGAVVLKSVDAGAHWAEAYAGRTEDAFSALAIAPSRPSTLFVAGSNVGGILRSTDAGASWSLRNIGDFAFVSALAVDPSTPSVVYAATGPQDTMDHRNAALLKSTDGGDSWRASELPLPDGAWVPRLVIDPRAPATIYAVYLYGPVHGVLGGGAIRSDDAGATWSALQSPPPGRPIGEALIRGLAIDPVDSRRLYATTSAGVFRSVDRAATWTALNDGLPTQDGVSRFGFGDLSIDDSGTLLRAATDMGVFEYRLGAAQASDVVVAIEYYNASFDHYFVTALPDEIALLDSGALPHWKPTGLAFNVYASPAAGTSPVCRFFSTAFGFRSTHFYTPYAFECAIVRADANWTLESEAVFHVPLPSAEGSCATGRLPVYRFFNDGHGGAPNHRYTTDPGVRAQMIAQGWVPEGLGPEAVQMCAP